MQKKPEKKKQTMSTVGEGKESQQCAVADVFFVQSISNERYKRKNGVCANNKPDVSFDKLERRCEFISCHPQSTNALYCTLIEGLVSTCFRLPQKSISAQNFCAYFVMNELGIQQTKEDWVDWTGDLLANATADVIPAKPKIGAHDGQTILILPILSSQ
jgi:hypothetical protein